MWEKLMRFWHYLEWRESTYKKWIDAGIIDFNGYDIRNYKED